jgi:hypothetical protein
MLKCSTSLDAECGLTSLLYNVGWLVCLCSRARLHIEELIKPSSEVFYRLCVRKLRNSGISSGDHSDQRSFEIQVA